MVMVLLAILAAIYILFIVLGYIVIYSEKDTKKMNEYMDTLEEEENDE